VAKPDGMRLLEQMLELRPGALSAETRLRDLDGWDSLATMTFIAMIDREFGLPLPGGRVARCQTVGELIGLLAAAPADRAA
jgi:acyl carrier protein